MLSKFEGSGTPCYKIFKKEFHSSPKTLLGGRINEAGVRLKVGGLVNFSGPFGGILYHNGVYSGPHIAQALQEGESSIQTEVCLPWNLVSMGCIFSELVEGGRLNQLK